ncbi:hypothetical protein LMH73_009145 [Vibrio splendidus]|nr:hypothetical protein [Vibrio splendidus]MCC4880310.1 hypothetical protein [Vibrio splendidus]
MNENLKATFKIKLLTQSIEFGDVKMPDEIKVKLIALLAQLRVKVDELSLPSTQSELIAIIAKELTELLGVDYYNLKVIDGLNGAFVSDSSNWFLMREFKHTAVIDIVSEFQRINMFTWHENKRSLKYNYGSMSKLSGLLLCKEGDQTKLLTHKEFNKSLHTVILFGSPQGTSIKLLSYAVQIGDNTTFISASKHDQNNEPIEFIIKNSYAHLSDDDRWYETEPGKDSRRPHKPAMIFKSLESAQSHITSLVYNGKISLFVEIGY